MSKFSTIIAKAKGKWSKSRKRDNNDQSKLTKKIQIKFFLTDARVLLRNKNDIWHVFNPQTRKWEGLTFDLNDIYDALPISKERAGKYVKKLLGNKN